MMMKMAIMTTMKDGHDIGNGDRGDVDDVDGDVHLAKVWFPWIRFAHRLVAAEAGNFFIIVTILTVLTVVNKEI